MTKIDKIIEKVKGLLAIAKDKKQDEEAKSALLLAQKLMTKYRIDDMQVKSEDNEEVVEVVVSEGGVSKWHEEYLASICQDNFPIKVVLKRNIKLKKTEMVFAGFREDVKLASEVFNLANTALKFHTDNHVKEYYKTNGIPRNTRLTNIVKTSYIKGFLKSLSDNFKKQKEKLERETALMILTPKEVEENYGKLKNKKVKTSVVADKESYTKGYKKGMSVDFEQKTLTV